VDRHITVGLDGFPQSAAAARWTARAARLRDAALHLAHAQADPAQLARRTRQPSCPRVFPRGVLRGAGHACLPAFLPSCPRTVHLLDSAVVHGWWGTTATGQLE
jgi:hypothetical protein